MKRRTKAGNTAIGIFVLAALLVALAFFTRSWLVSSYSLTGSAYNRLGLWYHCYRSVPEPQNLYGRRFFAGCRWVYDPFMSGYDQIRGYLVPTFLIMTQFFYTLTFIIVIICSVGVIIFFSCCTPNEERFVSVTRGLGCSLIAAGVSAALACLIFGLWANRDTWLPGFNNDFFGWSYFVAVISVIALIISGVLFLVENRIERRKRDEYDSQPNKA